MVFFWGPALGAPAFWVKVHSNLEEGFLSHGNKALELSPQEDLSIPSCCCLQPAGEGFFVVFGIPSMIHFLNNVLIAHVNVQYAFNSVFNCLNPLFLNGF